MKTVVAMLLLAILALGARCGGPFVTPRTGPGTAYPCGLQQYNCPGTPPGELACCGLDDICGAPHTRCPAGACCYDGPSGASRDAGAGVRPLVYPQRHR